MNNHAELQKIQEREIYHTCWRLLPPMLLNMTKKGFAPHNLDTRNKFSIDQNVNTNKNVLLVYLGNLDL